jgi:hypothetical protein
VSAKYGLLDADTPIAHYDVRMTREQALHLRPAVLSALAQRLTSRTYREVFLNMGKIYHMTLDGWDVCLSPDIRGSRSNGTKNNAPCAVGPWPFSV